MSLHDVAFAGEEAATKLARLRPEIADLKVDALVVSDPHAVAWLFNIRGADVSYTPLPLCFALVPSEGRPTIFIDGRKLTNAVRHRLEELADVHEPDALIAELQRLGARHATVRLDRGERRRCGGARGHRLGRKIARGATRSR